MIGEVGLTIRLDVLGPLALSDAEGAVSSLPGRHAGALLAVLALSPNGALPRDRLAGLLWSDRGEEQARHSLRQCLLGLRKELGEADGSPLVTSHDEVRLDRDRLAVDAWEFDRLVQDGRPEALARALALYRGDLVDGLSLRSAGFEEWLAGARARWRQRFSECALKLIGLASAAGDAEMAANAARRLLAVEPANEEAHRALMRLYGGMGRRAEALRQYQLCVEALKRELDAEPDAATRRLFDELRRSGGGDGSTKAAAHEAPAVPLAQPASVALSGATVDAGGTPSRAGPRRRWRFALGGAVAAVVAAAAVLAAVLLSAGQRIEPADPKAMAFALPDKPSIAVLPFREISGDSAPSGLTQGMAEDITTALSAIPDIFVIAPAAARPFADQSDAPGHIAEALGVRWVLDGSIQRVGEQVRISVQLSDALRGAQVWADRYDRAIEDVFALQDEITLKVVAALEVTVARGEAPPRAQSHGTRNLEAWLAASEGLGALRRLTPAENARARALYARAAELDPSYAGALEGLAWTHYIEARFNWSADPAASLATAAALVERTIALDPLRGRAYSLRGAIMLIRGDHARAVEFGERAVQLSPSDSEAMALLANTLTYTGDLERSLVVMEKAMRLSPAYPDWYAWNLARIYRMLGRAKDAVPLLDLHLKPESEALAPRLELILALVRQGDLARAKREAATIRAVEPHFSAARWIAAQPYADRSVADAELALLERAGLPR